MSIDRPAGLRAGFHAHLQRAGVPGLIHAGDQHAPTSWLIKPHSHHAWELYLQLGGEPTRWIAGGLRWEVPPRGLLAVPPRVMHAMAASNATPYHFYFAALVPDAILPAAELHPVWRQQRPFTIADAGSMISPFEMFLREVSRQQPLRTAGLTHCAAIMLIEASRLADGQHPARTLAIHPAIARARRLIETHLTDSPAVADLAAAAHLSPSYFAELFRAQTGETPGRYRARLRMERVRLLLAETDLPIAVIAADLGYSSPQHLATAFRRAVGSTPSRYRQAATGGPAPET